MAESHVKFSRLRHVLSKLGFKEVSVSKPYIGFRHDESDTLIVLPSYRGNAQVAPHHQAQVRITLDAKGLLPADEFDRQIDAFATRHSASS